MKNPGRDSSPVPDQVVEVLKNTKIGYLSVLSKKESVYSYPVAFHFSGLKIYFMTPVGASKFKILKTNPTVSFIVDNGKVTTEACGAMVRGEAKILSIGRTLISILSVGPKIAGFTKKYPGMLQFYARGKGLPDERKLYKYRLIQIDPSKIIYWLGYSFGRYVPKSMSKLDTLRLTPDESGVDVAAKLLASADEDMPRESISTEHDWLTTFESSVSEGILSSEEKKIIGSYMRRFRSEDSGATIGRPVSEEEKKLLKRSKYPAEARGKTMCY